MGRSTNIKIDGKSKQAEHRAAKEITAKAGSAKPEAAVALSYSGADDNHVLAIIDLVRNGIS